MAKAPLYQKPIDRHFVVVRVLAAMFLMYCVCAIAADDLVLVSSDTYRGVIIPVEMAQSVLAKRFDGYWLPTTNDIAEAEAGIAKFIAAAQDDSDLNSYERKHASIFQKNLKDYRRQYVGVLFVKQRLIFCNVLTTNQLRYANWTNSYIHLTEGAPDCWRIQYDLRTHQCKKFDPDWGY